MFGIFIIEYWAQFINEFISYLEVFQVFFSILIWKFVLSRCILNYTCKIIGLKRCEVHIIFCWILKLNDNWIGPRRNAGLNNVSISKKNVEDKRWIVPRLSQRFDFEFVMQNFSQRLHLLINLSGKYIYIYVSSLK